MTFHRTAWVVGILILAYAIINPYWVLFVFHPITNPTNRGEIITESGDDFARFLLHQGGQVRGTYQRHPPRPTWYQGGSDRKWPGRPCLATWKTNEGRNEPTSKTKPILNQSWLVVEPTLLKNMLVEMGIFPKVRGENTKYLKPPPRNKQTK